MRIRRFRTLSRWRQKLSKLLEKVPFIKTHLDRFFPERTWRRKFLVGFGSLFVILWGYSAVFLPSVDGAEQLAFAESTIIYNRKALDPSEDPNEHILYIIHGDENREYVPLEEISPWVRKATVAIEDDGFYGHFGFDIGGILKAGLNHFFGIGEKRGGSTITQQLVKNTFLSDRAYERSISRKFRELLLAIKVEWHYTKDEILELYLNNIPYGSNAYGIEAAAKTFFGKSSRELTLAEAAILASLPVAPTRFSPYGANKDLLLGYYEYDQDTGIKTYKKGRKDLVLQRMLDLKMITFEEFKDAWAMGKDVEFKRYRADIKAPHFVFYVRQKMEEKYGKEFLREGGLRIYTTLDPELQEAAEAVIAAKSANHEQTYGAKNAALVSLDADTGEILAYVGGKDYWDEENDGQVDVLTSRRQPGSSFKPYVYAAAFEKGYNPANVLFDVETDFGGNYAPQNFDGTFSGPVSFREALNRSLNIPAVKVAYLATPIKVLDLAKKLGVRFEGDAERHGVAIGIGVAEVEPLSHIAGYQAFTGDGTWHDPTGILEVHNSEGEVLEQFDPQETEREGVDPEVAALVRHVLTDESTRPTTNGFDWNVLLQLEGYNNGAKTGTSNRTVENPDFDVPEDEGELVCPRGIRAGPRCRRVKKDVSEEEKEEIELHEIDADSEIEIREDKDGDLEFVSAPGDSWTIGFTPHVVTGVWAGNNRGEPMKPGATGLAVAAPVWKRFMTEAHSIFEKRGLEEEKLYTEPSPLEVREVNRLTGKLSTNATPPGLVREEYFASFSVETEIDDGVQIIEVDKISGRPATTFTPRYARVPKYVLQLESIQPDLPNWKNPVDEWIEHHPKFMTSLGTIMDKDPEDGDRLGRPQRELVSRLSRLKDDVHNEYTANNPPKITILSPRKGGVVAPGKVEVKVAVSAKFEMRAVEFYLDDQLVDDKVDAPWTGLIRIPSSFEEGSSHIIKVIAIDRLFNTSSDEIEITLEQDIAGPLIRFLGPVGQQRLPLGSYVSVLVDVTDVSSGVNVVEFFLDGESLGFAKERPFRKSFVAEGDLGRHELMVKAWDFYGNESEKTIPLTFERERLVQELEPSIEKVVPYRDSVSVDVVFPDPEAVEWAELIAEQNQQVVFSQKLVTPPKFAEFQIQKNGSQRAQLTLYTKLKNKVQIHKSRPKIVDL